MSTIEPGRLYDKCIDDVLSHLLATQEEGDPPQLRHEDVQRLPPDITHDLLHRLLSSSTLPRRRKTAPVSPKPTFTSWAAPAALEAEERAKRVNDELLALLVSPHLTHLRLRMCVRVTDLSFQRLFAPEVGQASTFALREVKLDTCWGLTDNALHTLAKGCPSLTRLELIGSSRFTCNALDWPHLTSLQVLLVKACPGISESAFSYLADHPSTSLRAISILFQRGDDKPANTFLAQLAQMCPNLEELQLVRCFDPPAQGVAPLQPGQFGHLRALSLGDESLSFRPACVNERYLEALLDALPQLEALHCSQIYDVARLTNDQAARRLKVLITATTENSQIALLKSALKRTAATLQVLSVPTAIREAWGAGEVGFVPLSNEDCSELIALLALGLPSLRFLRFPTGRLSDLTQFLTDVQTSSSTSQMELHTLQIASLDRLREMTAEAVDETIFRRLPSSVRVVDLKCYFGMTQLDPVYNKLRAKYPHLVGPQTSSWSLRSSLLDFGYHIG